MINHVEFSRDGRTVFSSSADGTLRRWDVATGAGTIELEGDVPVRGFAVARDGRIAAQAANIAFLIDPAGKVSRLGDGARWCVDFAEFEPVRDRLVLHRCDKSLALVEDGASGPGRGREAARIIELPTGDYMVGHVAVSPDGRRIAGGLSDRTVRLWDAATGQVIDILRGHSDLVLDVAFSPDGGELASASYDKTIRIWDLASKRHRVLRGHTAPVNWVRWRGPAHLATGSPDGTIRIWNVPGLELPSGEDISHELETATTARIDLDRPTSGNRSARGT
jgi:WD40 repeat protein